MKLKQKKYMLCITSQQIYINKKTEMKNTNKNIK